MSTRRGDKGLKQPHGMYGFTRDTKRQRPYGTHPAAAKAQTNSFESPRKETVRESSRRRPQLLQRCLVTGNEGGIRFTLALILAWFVAEHASLPLASGFSLAPAWSPTRLCHVGSTSHRPQITALRSQLPRRALEGRPSAPGWKAGQLDRLTQWAVADEANRPIICEYEPSALWLWTKWRGTVLSLTIVPVLLNMGLGAGIDAWVHAFSGAAWGMFEVPPADDPLIQQLQGIDKLWEYQLTLTTFILTFFTSEAYKHWRSVYFTTRAIQGRVNDVCMLISLGAERTEGGGGATVYSERAERVVRTSTRLLKLSHTFFWAATPTCSNGVGEPSDELDGGVGGDIGPLLLSVEGLAGLVAAGELTAEEEAVLSASSLPPSQYTYTLLQWAGLHCLEGLRSGALEGGGGLESNVLRQLTSLRAEYFSIGDYTAGRMPLAYVQFVQVLVDSLVLLTPLALYPELGSLSIPLTGLLTLFYKGLLELSKSFLDPFGNEGYPGQNIRVDVLVSELNFGAANRWVSAGQTLPAPPAPPPRDHSAS